MMIAAKIIDVGRSIPNLVLKAERLHVTSWEKRRPLSSSRRLTSAQERYRKRLIGAHFL